MGGSIMDQNSQSENLCGQCRICMDIKTNQISIFKDDLSEKIAQLADIEIHTDDGLPTSICTDCEVRLNKCYEFREEVRYADRKFREGPSYSQVDIEECVVKEEIGGYSSNYASTIDEENYNSATEVDNSENEEEQRSDEHEIEASVDPLSHVEVMDVAEQSDKTSIPEDSMGLEEPLIEARPELVPATDPLSTEMESARKETDSKPSTSTAVEKSGMNSEPEPPLSSNTVDKVDEYHGLDSVKMDEGINIFLQSDSRPPVIQFHSEGVSNTVTTLVNSCVELEMLAENSVFDKELIATVKTKPHLKRKNIIDRNKSLRGPPSLSKNSKIAEVVTSKKSRESFCEACNVNCGSEDLLKDHKGGSSFICRVCVANFETHSQLETHFVSHPALVCPMCGVLYFSRKDLWNHRKNSMTCGYPMIECTVCHKSLLKTSLRTHMLNFHIEDSNKYRCIVCGKSYKRAYLLKNHLTSVHIVYERTKCKFCDRYLMGPDRMKDHIVAKHVEPNEDCEILICPDCGEKFRNKLRLKYHLEKHDKTVSLCELCGVSIEGKLALKSHMEKFHPRVGVFRCHLCNEVFDVELELKRHKKRHVKRSKPVPSFCEMCGKIFTSKANLKNHVRIHFNEKPFKCNICGYEFRQKVTLNTHMRVHSSEGKFTCNFCGKTFKWKQTFERHMSKCDGGYGHSQSYHQMIH